ncbi:MAG TPA: AI-2E family transporter [Blastocatellia bacterium]|nr:AI-2E family transporter [Blastocatellia bacterium]
MEEVHRVRPDGLLTRERVLITVLIATTALAIYICYQLVQPFLPAIIWAIALAVVANPLHERIERHIPYESIAAALSVFIVAILIIAPSIFVLDRVVREAVEGISTIALQTEADPLTAILRDNPFLLSLLKWVEGHINLQGEFERFTTGMRDTASSLVTGSFWAVVQLLITLFVLFYFFRDRRTVLRSLRSLLPLSENEADQVLHRVTNTIYATIYGTLVVAMIQGTLGGLMFWWLGLPAPVLWGVVMALLSLVPMLGSFVVWIPAAVLLLLGGQWQKALLLAGWGTVVVGMIDNILYPVLVGRRIRLHTLAVFFAVLGGLLLFGASGIILGPVVLSVTDALIDVWRRRLRRGIE